MSADKRARVVVHGQVQGVFFRDSTRRLAEREGVAGSVRNRADGAVEAVFEGEASAVDRLVEFCREGPSGAGVDRVEVDDEAPEGLSGFEVIWASAAPPSCLDHLVGRKGGTAPHERGWRNGL